MGLMREGPMSKKGRSAIAVRSGRKLGRPAEAEPVYSLALLKGTHEFEAWLDGLVEHTGAGLRSPLIKMALAEYATRRGFEVPQPRR